MSGRHTPNQLVSHALAVPVNGGPQRTQTFVIRVAVEALDPVDQRVQPHAHLVELAHHARELFGFFYTLSRTACFDCRFHCDCSPRCRLCTHTSLKADGHKKSTPDGA